VDRTAYGLTRVQRTVFAANPSEIIVADRRGHFVRSRRPDAETPTISFVLRARDAVPHGSRCNDDDVGWRQVDWRVRHPYEPLPHDAGLWLEAGSRERDFSRCLRAIEDARIETVIFLGHIDMPLPPWSPLHSFARAESPAVTVAILPITALHGQNGAAHLSLRELVAHMQAAGRNEDPQPRGRD
jgi:hypothetical protein